MIVLKVIQATGNFPQRAPLRRGKSLLARDEDVQESGLTLFKRAALHRRQSKATLDSVPSAPTEKKRTCLPDVPGPHDAWMIYCYFLTICIPNYLLRTFGTRMFSIRCDITLLINRRRYSYSRAATCMARENGLAQHCSGTHGWSWFPHIWFYTSSLRYTFCAI